MLVKMSVMYVILCCVGACLAERVVDRPVVHTTTGPIQGETVEYPAGWLSRYLGVPYGRPTGGSLRFTAPQTPEPWTETLNTTTFGHRCYQDTFWDDKIAFVYGQARPEKSEDCLYLNVYVPLPAASDNKAVMVWIHGGALTMGAGSDYPMDALTLLGDVISVSINYRLDVFGFIATEDDRAPGNVGFLDQVLALRWVQDNIAAFGGDPGKVTIFGESAGGWSVSAHMVSPLSRGLFTRAISQSGSLYGLTMETREERAERTRGMAASLDCPSTPEADMLTCLQNVPADTLLQMSIGKQFLATSYAPTAGGDFLAVQAGSLYDNHEINPGVDYMLGVNSDEMLVFLLMIPENQTKIYLQNGVSQGDSLYHMMLGDMTKLPQSQHHLKNLVTECAMNMYLPDLNDKFRIFRGLLDGTSDKTFVAPTVGTAARMAETDQNVYLYYFDHTTNSKLNLPLPNLMGAPELKLGALHGTEIYFMMGWLLVDEVPNSLAANVSDEDKAISSSMIHTWTTFAKTGKMTVLLDDESEMDWPTYDNTNQTYLEWKYPMTSATIKTRLRPSAHTFWNVLIPALLEHKSEAVEDEPMNEGSLVSSSIYATYLVGVWLTVTAPLC